MHFIQTYLGEHSIETDVVYTTDNDYLLLTKRFRNIVQQLNIYMERCKQTQRSTC